MEADTNNPAKPKTDQVAAHHKLIQLNVA